MALLLIGIIAHCTLPNETDSKDWGIVPAPNVCALASYVSAFLFLIFGFFGFFYPYFCSDPCSIPEHRKVELVIPGDAQMNAEIIRKNDRIHLKNL